MLNFFDWLLRFADKNVYYVEVILMWKYKIYRLSPHYATNRDKPRGLLFVLTVQIEK